ncbi:hypothetical protein AB6A40_005075 [Gnathostoma spinigerum]|uniref:Uncharacterized protein n=1 Tax=Gnathostoma spinigerum TaxID=75299 RepID=A0ABD6EFC8_9BILA
MAKSQTYHTTHVAHYVSSRSRENLASRPPLPYRSHPKPSSGRDSESYTLIRRSSSRELRTHVDHRFNDSKSHTFRSSPNGTSKTFIKTKKSYNELRNPASKNVEDSKGSSKRVVTPNAVKDGGRKSSSSEAVNSKIFENQVVSADDKMHLQDGSECLEKAHEEGNVKSEDLIKNTGDGTSSPELNSERHANDDKVPVNDANTGALIDLSEGEKRRCISDQMYPTTVDDESDQGLFAEMHRAEASSVLGQSLFAELRQAGESVMLDEGNTDAVVDMPKTAVENVDIDGISHIVGLSGYSAVAAGEEGGSSEEELGVILANSRMSANENFNVSGKETSKVSLAQERGESHLHVSEGLGSSSVSVSTAPNLNVGNLNVRNSEGSQESVSSHLPFEVGQEGSSSERLTAVCPSLQNKGMKGQTESTGSHLEEFVNGGEDDVRVRLTEERRKAIQERYDRNQRERDERRARLSAIMNRTRGSPVIFAETKASAKVGNVLLISLIRFGLVRFFVLLLR